MLPISPRQKFPFSYMRNEDYKHILAFKPNDCIQVDQMSLGKLANTYRLNEWYTVGVDVYSRYCCIYTNKYGTRGSAKDSVKGVLDLFDEYPEMLIVDSGLESYALKDFCTQENIKLVVIPTGVINTNSVVESTIYKIKNVLVSYLLQFNDIIEKRLEKNIDPYRHSYRVMNSIAYYLNRKFHTAIKAVPIEVYNGLDSPSLPMFNFVRYPQFNIGQKVLLRSRGRSKSFAFQERALKPGMPGEIIAKPTKNTYTIKTLKGEEINAKWYEFVPLTEEQYNKIKKVRLFSL